MEALSNFKYLLVALTLTLFSCTKGETDEIGNDQTCSRDAHINATISGSTKTSLNALKVNWSEDDVIGVFSSYDDSPSGFTLESGEGTSSGVFSGNIYGNPVYAKYPYNSSDSYENGVLTTDLPDNQAYAQETFATNVSPMAALPDSKGNFSFINLCSVLRLTLTGTNEIEEIVLTSEDEDRFLAGPAKIRLVEGKPVLTIEPTYTKSSSHIEGAGYESVHLDCGGTLLSPVVRSTFYIVVPSQVYESGLLIEIYTKLGKFSKHTGKIDLKSSTLYDIEPFDVKINGDIEPSEFLTGTGDQSSPYLVSSIEDLLHVQKAMSEEGRITQEDGDIGAVASTAWYLLTEDIDLSVCCGPELGSWQPLTVIQNNFIGHFDGGGHKITGLYIKETEGEGSFFGDIYKGGYLGNLEVEGDVTTEYASIVCGSVSGGTLENCIARGSSKGYMNTGGVAESNSELISNCVNYAEVTCTGTIYNSVGGIAGSSIGGSYFGCTNYGKITATTGYCHVGGIAGSIQQGVIANCCNYGEITGINHSAGIIGFAWDTDIANCANYGAVHGSDSGSSLCGGICGENSDPFSHKIGGIRNCINTATVDKGLSNCAICGKSARTTQYCYWVNTVSTGVSGGTQTGLVSISKEQMKGEDSHKSLYNGYKSPVDALNSYAFSNSTTDLKMQGWMYGSEYGWPVLTGRPALPPGELDKFIKTSPTSYTLNTYSQSIELVVTSSADVTLTLPDWISQTSLKTEKDGIILYSTYAFDVQQNKSGAQRTGSIDIVSSDGCSSSVSVTQRYTYISEDYTRDGNVVTVQKATEGNGIDIVLMGDAYTDADIKNGQYDSDMRRGIEAFFSVEPYASFRNLFNVYYVELVSSSSEIGSGTALQTYFGSGTLVGGNDSKARSISSSATKKSNMDDVTAVVIINTKRYAGTCYMYYSYTGNYGMGFSVSYFPLGTATTGTTSMEALIRHETGGHGFGRLDDEYSYQSMGTAPESYINSRRSLQTYGWWKNVDFTSDPFQVLWSKYIQDNRYASEKIDVYEGGSTYWSGVWRPTENSIMRYNTGQFNAPSREAIYYKIHKLAYGDSWTYDHEEFVEYDAVNRSSASQAAYILTDEEKAAFRPTHPPVILK